MFSLTIQHAVRRRDTYECPNFIYAGEVAPKKNGNADTRLACDMRIGAIRECAELLSSQSLANAHLPTHQETVTRRKKKAFAK